MDEIQKETWEMLCEKDGETVAKLFTDYYGTQLLTEEFKEFVQEETEW